MTQALAKFHLSHGPKNRPTLVFLPGALIPPNAIAPVTRIIKLRAIGVGWLEGAGPHDLHSVAARVAMLLRELGPTVLIGHSVGTPIAALAAAIDLRSTKRNVVGLVLSNSGANSKGHGDVESVIERVLQTWGPPLWKATTERSLRGVCPAELVDSFMTYPRRITAEATAESLRSLQQTDLTSMLSELSSVPTAVVHGSRDPARTLSHAQSLSNGIAGSRLVVLETGHTSCVEAPDEFAKVIRSIVEQGLNTGDGRAD
jgi:3-oxoadipate enol-lactonase